MNQVPVFFANFPLKNCIYRLVQIGSFCATQVKSVDYVFFFFLQFKEWKQFREKLTSKGKDEHCTMQFNYVGGRSFELTITNSSSTEISIEGLSIQGQKIDFVKTQLPKSSTEKNMLATRYPYTHSDSEFIQSEEHAVMLRNQIMKCYPEDTKSSSVQWRGDLNLGVSKTFELKDRFGETETYNCTYSKITVQGGMRQETKGVKKVPDKS